MGSGYLTNAALPRSVLLLDGMMTLIIIGGTRLSLRLVQFQARGRKVDPEGKRILIAGAGDAGQMVAREMHTSKYVHDNLIGFVDDDPIKIGTIIHNTPVLGPIDNLPAFVDM